MVAGTLFRGAGRVWLGFNPRIGDLGENFCEDFGRQFGLRDCSGSLNLRGPGQQHVLADLGEGRIELLRHRVPVVVARRRGR